MRANEKRTRERTKNEQKDEIIIIVIIMARRDGKLKGK